MKVKPFAISIASRSDKTTAKDACLRHATMIDERVSKRLTSAFAGNWRGALRKASKDGDSVRIDVGGAELDLWQLWPMLSR